MNASAIPNRKRTASLFYAAMTVVGFAHVGEGATFNVSWDGSASTLYNNPANWSGGVVPNNGGSNYYNVTVNRAGGGTVAQNIPATINNLTIGPGNIFIPQTGNTLTLIGTAAHGPCTITNNGTFSLAQGIPWSTVTLSGSTTNLTGTGTTRIVNGRIGGTGTLTVNQLITGRGELGRNGLAIINNGTITAGDLAADDQELIIDPGPGGLSNNGEMSALYNGRLVLRDGTFDNQFATIQAAQGNVSLSDAVVSGGTIAISGSREVTVSDSTIDGATLVGSGRARVSSVGTFVNVANVASIVIDDSTIGHFPGANTNIGTIIVQAGPGNATANFGSGTATLMGNGALVLGSTTTAAARVTAAGTLVNYNRIQGAGSFVGGGLVNNNLIRASTPGLELSLDVTGAGTGALNTGTITVDSFSRLRIKTGTWDNTGTLHVGTGTMQVHATAGPATLFNHGTISVGSAGRLETSATRTIDSQGGRFTISSGGIASLAGPLSAGSIEVHGTLEQSGPMTAGDVEGLGTLNVASPATTASVRRVRLGALNVTGALTIRPDGTAAAVSRLQRAPQFTGAGRMDLTDNALVVDYTGASPLATVRAQLVTGYAAGAWNGAQLTSSVAAGSPGFALGYGESGAVFTSFPATFAGQLVDSTTLLVSYTRYGDANLDGVVNLQDFNRMAGNFGASGGAAWTQGDFNYDGNVNLQDFNRLASNFGLSAAGAGVTPGEWSALAAALPEPVAASAAMLVAAPLLLRRPINRRTRARRGDA